MLNLLEVYFKGDGELFVQLNEDLMCLFKCGLFCVKYQMNYKQ